jgi:hypothetical protein
MAMMDVTQNTCEQYLVTLGQQQRAEDAERDAMAERCGFPRATLDALLSKSHEYPGIDWRP